jgi:predicted ABC-type exoprotein transport system permease subunit
MFANFKKLKEKAKNRRYTIFLTPTYPDKYLSVDIIGKISS